MSRIIDVCTVNGEKDLWDIHYNVLKDYVDEFIVVEFDQTFSGTKKDRFHIYDLDTRDYPKATFKVHLDGLYEKYKEMAEQSPNTVGAEHWKREFAQKESIKDALTHLNDDDIVFVGDVDEIWEPEPYTIQHPIKLKLTVYTYWLNNKSSEDFWGTLVSKYGYIKNNCLNHLRSINHYKTRLAHGWHFTSMGGYEAVKKKLEDSYTRESYWTPAVESSLEANIDQGKDFLGRGFTYHLDESDWPKYLKDNKEKYSHLCKPEGNTTDNAI